MLAVDAHQIQFVWDEVAPRLLRIRCNDIPLTTIRQKLETRHYQLWLVGKVGCDGIVITCRFDDSTGCIVIAEGSDFLRHLPEIMADLDRYAEEIQITRWEIAGRPGWARVLSPFGYRREGAKVVKDYG